MTELVQATALVSFSKFVEGYGVVHGDPDSSDERARYPLVPASAFDELEAAAQIEAYAPKPAAGGAPKATTPKAAVAKSPKAARAKPAAGGAPID